MRLVLRSDTGESVSIEVLPEDTFEMLSNRLYEQGSFSVNLKQLSSETKPFEMTSNVMEYFETLKGARKKETEFAEKLEKENEQSSMISESFVTSSSVTESDQFANLPNVKPIIDDPLTSLGETQMEPLQIVDHKIDQEQAASMEGGETSDVKVKRSAVKYCRLCACTIEEGAMYIFQSPTVSAENNDGEDGIDSLADKINEALPILVSKEDELPKQVCLSCVDSLNASHAFTRRVTAADDLLKKLLYQSNEFEKNMHEDEDHCPLCCDGSMKVLPRDEIPEMKEEYEHESNEEIEPVWGNGKMEGNIGDYDDYDEYYEEGSIYMRNKKRGRPKGSRNLKRQYPWDDVDDEDWSIKEESSSHKKRGRPKGSKNKSNQQEQPVQCCLCSSWHSDTSAVLAHTLEVHCVDETSTFPCPLCKSIQPDEGELIYHVSNHSNEPPTTAPTPNPTPSKVKMWGCPLCGQIYEEHDELGNHLLSDHVQAASPQYQCPLCDHAPTSGPRLAHHITDSHTGPPGWNCPLCEEGHEGKSSVSDHVVRSHVSVAAQTTQCPLCEMQYMTDEAMAEHLLKRHAIAHTHILDRPALHYTCSACGANFKTQFNLVKHACPLRQAKKLKKNSASKL